MVKIKEIIKKGAIQLIIVCMTICLLTPIEGVQALNEGSIPSEVVVLSEDETLRDASSKTFLMSDKSLKKVIYSVPVHYLENGEWKEIDNTLIDDEAVSVTEETNEIITETEEVDSEITETEEISIEDSSITEINSEVTINEENTEVVSENNSEEADEATITVEENVTETEDSSDEVVGYKNKEGNLKIKFSKKVHQKNMVSIQNGDYKVKWGITGFENQSNGVVTSSVNSSDIFEAPYHKVDQTITYANIYEGIDLVYLIDSVKIKENIVIHESTDMNEFTFEYKVDGLKLVLNDNGEIEALNEENEVIFMMPKPFMYDDNDIYCEDVHYEIIEKNKKYNIKIVANKEWMNSEERVYPIVIDPVIKTETTKSAIDTTFIASGWANTNFSGFEELLVGKESSAYINCRTLLKFVLPSLNRGDMIIEALMMVASFDNSFYTTSTPDLQVNAHQITSNWAYNSVTWNTQPTHDGIVLDYDYIKKTDTSGSANWKQFDITKAVKSWYSGSTNYGILLKSYNEDGTYAKTGVKGYLWPERYNSTTRAYPYIILNYRNNKGLESYWDYSSFSTVSGGNVYIDNYSGNLVVSHQDASTYGSLAPVSISHIYNGYMAGSNVANVQPYVGYGWKLNIQQTLRASSQYGLTGTSATTYPYVYMDGDGTEHYFMKKDSQYLDEDGLGLELKVLSSGYTITDKDDNVMTFNSSGNITQLKDSNGNTIEYTYTGNMMTKVTGGNGQSLTLSYDDNHYLTKITDQAGRETSYTYTNNLLTSITYPDGKVTSYSYDSDHALQEITSQDGTSVLFSYTVLATGKQVNKVEEYGSDESKGQTIKFDRSNYNITIITTSGIDNTIDTDDDVKTELQFDDGGRLTTKRAYTDDKDLGVEVFEFTAATANEDKNDIQSLNHLKKVGALGKNVNNMLVNHSGETTASWNNSTSIGTAEFTFESTTEEKLFGNASLKLNATASENKARARFYLDMKMLHMKANTTYTASVYIKTDGITAVEGAEDYGAALLIWIDALSMPIDVDPEAADYVSEYITGTTDEAVNDGWRRVSVTFTTPEDVEKVRYNCMIRSATGTAYFDGFQLELGEVAHPYNMVINNGFERTSSSAPTIWKKVNLDEEDLTDTSLQMSAYRSMKITSSVGKEKYLHQTINIEGKETDSYILSGWSYGKGIRKNDGSTKHDLAVKITYSDGTTVREWKKIIS